MTERLVVSFNTGESVHPIHPPRGSGHPGDDGRCEHVADVGELYRLLAGRLERIVRVDVRAPDVVIEDACQFAWSRLVHHAHRVRRESALSWLAQTAVHEALKLIRREDRELSLDDAGAVEESTLRSHMLGPHELAEHRERLALVATLPDRQRRMVWLRAAGLSYNDISAREGCTVRTVERQLVCAKRTLVARTLE
jgi:RNA polymerase sigma factor (sigma-70 family)